MSESTPCTIALDVHAHLAPIQPAQLAGIDGVSWVADTQKLTIDGHTVGIKSLFQPNALLAWMDTHHVERAWVSIPPPLYRPHLAEAAARDWARYVNDGLVTICGDHADRLAPLLHLPLEHPDLAVEIVEAASADARFAAAAGGYPGTLSDASLEPLWHRLDSQGTFVFLHPGACCDGRLRPFYLENLAGNPIETTVAVSHLVFGGVSDRYPRIRFCLAHGGGATAMFAGRFERGYATARPDVDTSLSSPRSLLGRFYVDCIVHDAAALQLIAGTFGEDRVLFGSDWPFPMGIPEPHVQLAGTDAALLRRVLQVNALTLRDGSPLSENTLPPL